MDHTKINILSMHNIITTLFTRSWLLALAGAAVIGAQPVSAQTTE
jgi:hypothetical protein